MKTPDHDVTSDELETPSAPLNDDLKLSEEGVGPFTDYGQFGIDHLDTRVLWQDDVWVDRLGTPHCLTEMSPDYLDNVIGYLYARAPEWHYQRLLAVCADLAEALAENTGDVQELADDVQAMLTLHPTGWVDDAPLMRRLRRLRAQGGLVAGPRPTSDEPGARR